MSKIEWTDVTWNPVRGCSRVSEGCRNCYAERVAARFCGPGQPFEGFVQITNGHPQWTGKVELVESRLMEPLHWKKPRRVFVNSMSDLFHESLPDDAIDRVFAVMALCPQNKFQVLTKRAERMKKWFGIRPKSFSECGYGRTMPGYICRPLIDALYGTSLQHKNWTDGAWPLPNVWLGVSVEDRSHIPRIDDLRLTPAAVRFLSLEPLLEDLGRIDLTGINWVICGGEFGPGARPMHPDWARSVRDQCVAAGVPFFFKQYGEWAPLPSPDWKVPYQDFTNKQTVWRVGKKRAGRLLDGREHNEFPAVTQ